MCWMALATPLSSSSRVSSRRVPHEFTPNSNWLNPTGSMKDRVAKAMVVAAEVDGRLRPGGTIVEYTAGTRGISLALVCAAKGYRLKIVFSDAFSEEKAQTMRALGAEVIIVPSDQKRTAPPA